MGILSDIMWLSFHGLWKISWVSSAFSEYCLNDPDDVLRVRMCQRPVTFLWFSSENLRHHQISIDIHRYPQISISFSQCLKLQDRTDHDQCLECNWVCKPTTNTHHQLQAPLKMWRVESMFRGTHHRSPCLLIYTDLNGLFSTPGMILNAF